MKVMPWRDWITALVFLLGMAALTVLGSGLASTVQLAIWAVLLLAFAYYVRPTVQQFFGPVLYCDLVRTTRRGRSYFVRCGYAIALLVVLYFLFLSWANDSRRGAVEDAGAWTLPPHEMAEFAYSFFSTFLIAQFALVVLLTPIYAASAITEEKERRTLEFLLATDLGGREIILSKLASRLAQLALVVLAGLPILGLLQFFGGVDPNLLLAAFAATGLTMLSLTSLSLLLSVYCKTAWDAIFRTYLVAALLALVSGILGGIVGRPVFSFGNPIVALHYLGVAAEPGAILVEVLLGFALFHVLLAAACCLWAILALRTVALEQAAAPALPPKPVAPEPDPLGDIKQPRRQRPPVSDRALLWKELYDEPFGWQGRNPVLDTLALWAAWVGLPFILILVLFTPEAPMAAQTVNGAIRIFGTAAMTFSFLLTGLNAAGRFSREFERQTLDNLLTVPERHGILFAKWWASVLHMRGLWWFLAWLWGLGVISGGLHVGAVLLLGIAGLTYASFVAALGIWFSLVTRSTLRATIWTLLSTIGVMLGTWLVAGWLADVLALDHPRLARLANRFQEWGAVAPWTLWVLAFPFRKPVDQTFAAASLGDILIALTGVAYYAALAGLLWTWARARFGALVGAMAAQAATDESPRPS